MDERAVTRLFDDTTGMETDESAERTEQDALEDALIECQAVTDMTRTPGWRWINMMLLDRIDQFGQDLLECTEMASVVQLQNKIRAHRDLIALVESKVLLGNDIAQRLKETGPSKG